MKLLRFTACRLAVSRGNVSKATVMGDAMMEESSDAGSIPASSIARELSENEPKAKFELSRRHVSALSEQKRA